MINFPKHHIADEVVARIMLASQKMKVNSVAAQGQRLDMALQQPIGDVAPIEGIDDAIALKALDI